MAVIGELATLITAKTAPFMRGMKESRGAADRFRGTVIKAGAAITSMVGISRGISAIKEQFSALDDIAKLSARIGETTDEISRLQFAADLTGASNLAGALDVMSKRLGEAERGGGAAVAALKKLNLPIKELLTLSPADQFKLIADRVSQLGTQAEKTGVAANIFSRSNLDLVNTLDLGRSGLEAMAEESDKFGNTVRQSDVPAIEAANDAMARFRATTTGLTREFAVGIAPALDDFSTALAEMGGARVIINGIRDAFLAVRSAINGALISYFQLSIAMNKVVGRADTFSEAMVDNLRVAIKRDQATMATGNSPRATAPVGKAGAVSTVAALGGEVDPVATAGLTFAEAFKDGLERTMSFDEFFPDVRRMIETDDPEPFKAAAVTGPTGAGAMMRGSAEAIKILGKLKHGSSEREKLRLERESADYLRSIEAKIDADFAIAAIDRLAF